MGSGSGRTTDGLLRSGIGSHSLDLVDLNKEMTAHSRQKYADVPGIAVFESDLLDYLQASTKSYSAAFSLWGVSYSVHHRMNDMGTRAGTKFAGDVITKFIIEPEYLAACCGDEWFDKNFPLGYSAVLLRSSSFTLLLLKVN